jgi:hypothetical protein
MIRTNQLGSCVPTALYCIPDLKDGRDLVIEGTVRFPPSKAKDRHTWLIINGQLFDPTLVQFARRRHFDAAAVIREEVHRLEPSDYLAAFCVGYNQFWHDRLIRFGVDPMRVIGAVRFQQLREEEWNEPTRSALSDLCRCPQET